MIIIGTGFGLRYEVEYLNFDMKCMGFIDTFYFYFYSFLYRR